MTLKNINNGKEPLKKITAFLLALAFAASCCFVPSAEAMTVHAEGGNETPVSSEPEAFPPEITSQPESITVKAGYTGKFSVAAEGTGTLRYQWYYRKAGSEDFSLWTGMRTAEINPVINASWDGMEVRCEASDAYGNSVTSDAAKLTVLPALKITSQPEKTTIHSGETATFTVKAEGSGLKYQWYYKKAGKDWVLWKNHTEATTKGTADCTWHGMEVKCHIVDSTGESIWSDTAYSFITKKSGKRYITRTATVKSGGAKLYSDAGTNNKLLGSVSSGKTFTVLEWKSDSNDLTWFRVSWNGKNAWLPRTKVNITNKYTTIPDRSFKAGGIPIIYLSPSRQIHNEYKYGSTTEGEQMYRVGNELKKILEEEYYCLVYMPPVEMKIDMPNRPTDAYNKEADVYLAIHSNANPSGSSYGAIGYYFPGCPQSERFAENMTAEMDKVSPFRATSSIRKVDGMLRTNNVGYGEVRDPAYFGMVSLLAEVEYHDNSDSARWIINNPKKIARALANSLEKTFDLQKR